MSTGPDPFATAPNPDSIEARLARAEEAVGLLLRMLHAHGLMHELARASWPLSDELIPEWNRVMTRRFGDEPGFQPLEEL